MSEASDQNEVVLANLPAGPTERRIALSIGFVLLAIGIVTVPFGKAPHQASNTVPAVEFSLAFLADLITWFLLIPQFRIVRSRALLVLASGYLFISLMNIAQLLTMWGQFSPTGLLQHWPADRSLAGPCDLYRVSPRSLLLRGNQEGAATPRSAELLSFCNRGERRHCDRYRSRVDLDHHRWRIAFTKSSSD